MNGKCQIENDAFAYPLLICIPVYQTKVVTYKTS
jgi:hypothetical protein